MENKKVYAAIVGVQEELSREGIGKNRTCTQGASYKFRGIDDVYNALASILPKHKLCILPRMLTRTCVERESKAGSALFYTTVEAEFDFVSAEDGSCHTVRTFGEAMDSGDKGTNKAMSAAYKYAAFQALCIPTEGDNDTENQTHEVAPRSIANNLPVQNTELRDELLAYTFGDEKDAAERLKSLSAYKDRTTGEEKFVEWARLDKIPADWQARLLEKHRKAIQ